MFVSRLAAMCFAVLIVGSASGKTADTNYNPIIDTLRISRNITQHETNIRRDGSLISLCDLEINESYLVLIEIPQTDCIPFVELFAMATPQAVAHSLGNQRANRIDNRRFSFVANQKCMDLYLAPGACIDGSQLKIKITKRQNERLSINRSASIRTFDDFTPQQLIEDVLVGGGCFDIVDGSIRAIGNPRGIGYFNTGMDAIDIEEGVILASGDIFNAEGPNLFDATSGYLNVGFNENEPDLELLLPGTTIFDVTGLEFEFTPTTDHVEFRYVFASEEYCEFVGSRFNDVFGFFIQGPGINGGFTGNGENIALVPGTNDQVSINMVNHIINTPYYVKNETFLDAIDCNIPFNPQALGDIEYDGFTVVLTASVDVIPCQTYKIKMVIADVSDRRLDSAVFLEANSFNAGGEALVRSEIPYSESNMAYESCTDTYFYFERADENLEEPLSVIFHLSDMSTAEAGVDFAPLPDSIVIPAGEKSFFLPIEVYEDNLDEIVESIVIELENPCSCETPFTDILIADIPPLEVIGLDGTSCEGAPANLEASIEGGVPGFSYQWSTGDTSSTVEVIPDEDSFYTLTVTDACGKTASDAVSIDLLQAPFAELSGSDQICPESPVAALPVSLTGSGPWSLRYSVDGVEQDSITGIQESKFSLPASLIGSYALLAVADNGCQGEVSGQATVVATEINLSTNSIPVSCFEEGDGKIELSLSGNGMAPFAFQWSNGSVSQNATNLPEGSYDVIVTDASGCTATISNQVILDPEVPYVQASADKELTCEQTAIQLDGTGSSTGSFYAYNWATTEGNILGGAESLNPVVDQPGVYSLIVTNTKTDCSIGMEVLVNADTIHPNVVITTLSAQSTIDCYHPSVVLDGSSSLPFGELIFNWTTEDGRILQGNDSPNPEVDKGGQYKLTVTDPRNGCKDSESVEVATNTDPPNIEIAPPAPLTCFDTIISIDAGGSSSGTQFLYNWTTPDGTIDSGPNSLHPKVSRPGAYQLEITDQENGCVDIKEIVVQQDIRPPLAEAGTAEEIICDRPVVDLDGSNSSVGGNYSYQWSSIDGNFTFSPDIIATSVDAPGTYVLLVTNLDNGCSATDEVVVTANTNHPTSAEIIATPPVCFGDQGKLEIVSVTGGEGPYVYSFDGGDSYLAYSESPPLMPNNYSIVIMDMNGCSYQTSASVPQTNQILIDLEPEVTIELGDSYDINATVNIPLSTIDQINWAPNDSINCFNCLNLQVRPINNTRYSVDLIDKDGCTAEASILIRINRDPVVYIPSAFSPYNGDGINDRFLVYAKESSIRRINTFQIFTRWGGKVFEVNNCMPNDETYGWNGLNGSQQFNPGVFVYFVEIEFIDGRKQMFKGDVTLLD